MNRGNMGKQISNAPKSKSKKVKKMFGGGMASMPMPGGMPGSAVRPPNPGSAVRPPNPGSAVRPPNPGSAVRPMPVKPMPGGVRGMSSPKPSMLQTQGPATMPGRTVSSAVPAEMQRAMPMGMAKGGKVTRADGCCMKGHTKGTMK